MARVSQRNLCSWCTFMMTMMNVMRTNDGKEKIVDTQEKGKCRQYGDRDEILVWFLYLMAYQPS